MKSALTFVELDWEGAPNDFDIISAVFGVNGYNNSHDATLPITPMSALKSSYITVLLSDLQSLHEGRGLRAGEETLEKMTNSERKSIKTLIAKRIFNGESPNDILTDLAS